MSQHRRTKAILIVHLTFVVLFDYLASHHLLVEAGSITSSNNNNKSKASSFEIECLESHNKWRRLHGVPELTINKKITQFAQKRADHIAKSDGAEFKHPDDLPYGENLAWHSRSSTSCSALIKMWYDEVSKYDFKNGGFGHSTGHFTQLVWKDTSEVGCAKAVSSGPRGGVTLVCNYNPPGNFIGEFQSNVFPKGKNSSKTTKKPKKTSRKEGEEEKVIGTTSKPLVSSTSLRPNSIQAAVYQSLSTTTSIPVGSTNSTATNVQKKKKNKKNRKNKNKNKKVTTSTRKPENSSSTTPAALIQRN